MENLPILFFKNLFEYLTFKEKVKCSLVCQKWRSVYEFLKPSKIYVYYSPMKKRSFLQKQWISSEFKDILEASQLFKNEIPKGLFENIKKLIVSDQNHWLRFGKSEINFKFLKNFINLEHLEIDTNCFLKKETEEKLEELNLPKLKVLIFKEFFHTSPFKLNCPKLEVLITNRSQIEIGTSSSIKYLDFIDFRINSNSQIKFISKFTNLEYLILDFDYESKDQFNFEFLNNLLKLKFLVVFTNSHKIKRVLESKYSKNSLNVKIFNKLKEYVSTDGFVFLSTFNEQLNLDIKTLAKNSNSKNYIECLDDLKESPNIIKHSINLISNRLEIKSVFINSRIDDNMLLIKFFKKIGFVEKIVISNFLMDQVFYDLLPKCVSIQRLLLNINDTISLDRKIKLDFLSELNVSIIQLRFNFLFGDAIDEEIRRLYSIIKIILSNNKFKKTDINPTSSNLLRIYHLEDRFELLNKFHKEVDEVVSVIDQWLHTKWLKRVYGLNGEQRNHIKQYLIKRNNF